jgi:membrane protein DedA with SNARE-associated domain
VFPTAGFLASQQGITLLGLVPMILLGGLGATIGTSALYLIALKLIKTRTCSFTSLFEICKSE